MPQVVASILQDFLYVRRVASPIHVGCVTPSEFIFAPFKIPHTAVYWELPTRSSAQGNCSAKSLAVGGPGGAGVQAGGAQAGGVQAGGVQAGGSRPGGGRGHFIHPVIYCTATWRFALKGLRTITAQRLALCTRRSSTFDVGLCVDECVLVTATSVHRGDVGTR